MNRENSKAGAGRLQWWNENEKYGQASLLKLQGLDVDLRLFGRRNSCLAIDFSKTSDNHQHPVVRFGFHFHFRRIYGALQQTPVMAAKIEIENHPWAIE